MLMQVAPSNACSGNPENPVQDKAVIPRTPTATSATLNHERLKTGPFLIAHQTTDHGSFPKSYLESEPTRFGNSLCQHALAVPGAIPLLPAVIVTQTLVELVASLIYIRLMPLLGNK